ncbi:MAG: hypothetical protein A4E50_01200 [Methanosaeta sp. PtaB.Bin087]|nr:MAG: hypothetical protein A4E50_01200 [Methanosaeta sp. PtaB.Bin087]
MLSEDLGVPPAVLEEDDLATVAEDLPVAGEVCGGGRGAVGLGADEDVVAVVVGFEAFSQAGGGLWL